uniref:Ig-like domain-containing protein n=1 Tax=Prolemur simus TaxID=1328070 RepID=A0A8C8Z4K3_PROSS
FLLWATLTAFDAVVANVQVGGMVGQPVTLPCTYSVAGGAVTSMCWGRGACPIFRCSNEIIWTDGSRVTFQKHDRYQLRGDLLKGNVSLTIDNAAEADSGLYCCRVEHRGWFNDMKVTVSLEIKPDGNGTVTQSSDGPWHDNQTCHKYPIFLIINKNAAHTLEVVSYSHYSPTLFCSMVSLNNSKIGALQHAAERRRPVEDNVYIIDDNPYVMA